MVELLHLLHYLIISRSRVAIQLGCTSLQAYPVRIRLEVVVRAQKINVIVGCGVVRARGNTTARHEARPCCLNCIRMETHRLSQYADGR
jgi:hypothetical protein